MKKSWLSAQIERDDNAKLERLAIVAQRSKSDVVRLLIRAADERQFVQQIHIDVNRAERA